MWKEQIIEQLVMCKLFLKSLGKFCVFRGNFQLGKNRQKRSHPKNKIGQKSGRRNFIQF